jgi:hypothetical protein
MKRNVRVTINMTEDEASWMSANLDGIAGGCDDEEMSKLCSRIADQIFSAMYRYRNRARDGDGDLADDYRNDYADRAMQPDCMR